MPFLSVAFFWDEVQMNQKMDPIRLAQVSISGLTSSLKEVLIKKDEPIPAIDPVETQLELRDPFYPSNIISGSDKRNSKRLLDGLIYRENKEYALIKGKMVTLGDWVNGMRVIMIRNDKAVLANNKRMRVLYLF